MTCSNCSKPHAPDDKFCGNCGYKLDKLICPSCSNPVAEQDRFCGDCGYALKQKVKQSQPELNNKTAVELNNKGLDNYDEGNYTLAIQLLSQAIKKDPELSIAYSNRGLSYIKVGNLKSALQDYNQAIHLNPDNEYAFFNRGSVYLKLGNKKKAKQDFEITQRFSGELEQRAKESLKNAKRNTLGWPLILLYVIAGAALSDFILNIDAVQNFRLSSYLPDLFERLINIFQRIQNLF